MIHKRFVTVAFTMLAVLAALCVSDGFAQDSAPQREDELKAAYLFNFLKFIEWPPGGNRSSLTVCFVGAKGMHAALSAGIENKRVRDRRLNVRAFEPTATLVISGCDVLYLDSATMSTKLRLPPIEEPLLTVSDFKEFARSGGMIELFTESNRLRFNVNVDSARRAGLRISSSLLQLAANVEKGGSQ